MVAELREDLPSNISTLPAASIPAADKDKVLPLPGWLVKVYFIFPVVLYIPDAIFNFFVYSDGISPHSANPALNLAFDVLWGFLALGVVGMAYLLSVLAPWHWGQGHRIQAFFCAMGVLVATAITTWCSLAFRSQSFKGFVTDQWIYSVWPQLRNTHFSLTMLLVAIAPPFWGLFWAVVQPTSNRRSLREIQESHQERLLRTQQEAELKQLKADTSAKVREAQLRGMASTAAAARKQASQLISQRKSGKSANSQEEGAAGVAAPPVSEEADSLSTPAADVDSISGSLAGADSFSVPVGSSGGRTGRYSGPNDMFEGTDDTPAVEQSQNSGNLPSATTGKTPGRRPKRTTLAEI